MGAPSPEFPSSEMEITHILVVSDLDRSRDWYRDVLGAELYREYGGFHVSECVATPRYRRRPTEDKPDVTFEHPSDPTRVSHSMTIRVPDCYQAYDVLRARGASFLTPPHDWGGEVRCFFRDPDGHLFEISSVG